MVQQLVYTLAETEVFARDADPHAAQAITIEKLRVVRRLTAAFFRHWIARVFARQRTEQDRCICNRARHWSSGVLAMRNRNDARPAHESDSRFDPDQRIRG